MDIVPIIFDLLLVAFLVFMNGFFVASEFACVKIRPSRLEMLIQEGNRRARLSVNTKGEPIPKEQRERIFERFYRSDEARSSGGFGLGLPIARSIAAEHQGKLWVESSREEGNTFYFTMPRC